MTIIQVGSNLLVSLATGPGSTSATPAVIAGDVAIYFAYQRPGTSTALAGFAAANAMTVEAHAESATFGSYAILRYRFTGSLAAGWAAQVNGSTVASQTLLFIGVVMRGVDATTAIDVLGAQNQFAASTTATAAGATAVSGGWAFAGFASVDNNGWMLGAWSSSLAGGSSLGGSTGNKASMQLWWKSVAGGASSGSVDGTESGGGPDAGVCRQFIIRAAPYRGWGRPV